MKLSYLRPTLLLALAAALTACGGKATFEVDGTINNLVYPGLELTNLKNGDTLTVAPGATTFVMPQTIEYGTEYDVVVSKPALHQSCKVRPGTGADTAGRLASINVVVDCPINTFKIGGKVSGVTAAGLVLVNGSEQGEQVAVPKDAVGYTFPKEVPFDATYGVVILSEPDGLNCTVANPVGKMGDAAVTNIDVTCVPAGVGG